jgi:hypothetical protein
MAAQDFLARPKMHYVRVNMLRADAEADDAGGDAAKEWKSGKEAGCEWRLERFYLTQHTRDNLRCTITCSHCVLNRQIDAYPAYGRHRVGGISLTKMALSRVVDFPYHCTFPVTPAIARCFVTD